MSVPYVNLYGYNVDIEHLKSFTNIKDINSILKEISPVTIAIACAGISHQEKNFRDLREKYRNPQELIKLSEKLVKMGHSSIIEHMYFNFDIILTRLAVESLESRRLASYTEKSQRFTVVKPDAFYLPPYLLENEEVKKLLEEQISFYQRTLNLIREKLKEIYREKWENYDSKAKEDARFVLPLSILSPLEFSVNGRELEYIIQQAKSSELEEIKTLGLLLEKEIKEKVPFIEYLIKYTESDAYFSRNNNLEKRIKSLININDFPESEEIIIEIDPKTDEKIIAAIIFENSLLSYQNCLSLAQRISPQEKEKIILEIFKEMKAHQRPPRDFEMADIVIKATISASCYAQLKRHRMLTLITQDYDPELGFTIPSSVKDVGLEEKYARIINKSSKLFEELRNNSRNKLGATYILTNAHRRRVIIKMNLRELYHFSRLRQDSHAQWEIRELTNRIVEKVKKEAPITSLLLCGKDSFPTTKERVIKQE